MSATIRSVILSDPRSAGLSAQQIDTMVGSLTKTALAQQISSHEILWRPVAMGGDEASLSADGTCGNSPLLLCQINQTLGLPATDIAIPIWIGVIGIVALVIAAGALELHHRRNIIAAH